MSNQLAYQFATASSADSIEGLNATKTSNHNTRGGISKTTSYQNDTGIEICIMDRNGLVITIPGKPTVSSTTQKCLCVYERWSKDSNVKINVDEEFSGGGKGSKYTGALLTSFEMTNDKLAESMKDKSALILHKLNLDNIKQAGGGIYVHTLDIVVYIPSYRKNFIHPYCLRVLSSEIEDSHLNANSLKIRIWINDPEHTMGDRFVNAGGSVYRISPTRDKRKPAGAILETVELDQPSTVIPCTLSDLGEHIQTFSTYEEAEKQGKQHELKIQEQNRQLEELKTNNMMLQENLNRQKAEQSLTSTEQKSKIELATHNLEAEKVQMKERQLRLDELAAREKQLLEMQQLRAKDYYDHRSHDRKDTSEFLKFLPLLLGAGIGLLLR